MAKDTEPKEYLVAPKNGMFIYLRTDKSYHLIAKGRLFTVCEQYIPLPHTRDAAKLDSNLITCDKCLAALTVISREAEVGLEK